MKYTHLKKSWLDEEQQSFTGWDFSRLDQRMIGEGVPWDYKAMVLSYMRGAGRMLDMGTGGGEFLLSLSPPQGCTFATEAYPPNFELCRSRLPAHGIEVRQVFSDEELPFADDFFDLVINRHEAFSTRELYRILKPGGRFVTQQVGERNNRELAHFLLGRGQEAAGYAPHNLEQNRLLLQQAGFTVDPGEECYPVLRFYDVGALAYFAKIIEWEFPAFSVEACYDRLCLLQERLEREGCIESTEHRFVLTAQKPL